MAQSDLDSGSEELNEATQRMSEVDDLVDVRVIVWAWIKWSWLIVVFMGIGAYMAYGDVRTFTPAYIASMTIEPVSAESSGGISSLTSAVGGALGIEVSGGGGADPLMRLQVMLGSRVLAARLQEKYGLLQAIDEGSWDDEAGAWREPQDQKSGGFLQELFPPAPWVAPNIESLAKYVSGAVIIDESIGKGFVEISFRHPDRKFAHYFLDVVFTELDDLLREQDRANSRERREYLRSRLADAKLVDSRQALVSLLTGEERQAMLLESDLPYVGSIIDPLYVSATPTRPNYRRIMAVPIAGGALLALLLITLVVVFRRG